MKLVWSQIIIALLIGLVIGTYFDKFTNQKQFPCRPPCFAKMKDVILDKFSKDLNLTSKQKKELEKILEKKHEKIIELRSEIHPKFKALHESTRKEIKAILTQEQIEKFDKLHKDGMMFPCHINMLMHSPPL